MFSYHGANGPVSNTTLHFKEVNQVAVPAGRLDNYSVLRIVEFIRMWHQAQSLLSAISLLTRKLDPNAANSAVADAKGDSGHRSRL